MNNNCILLDIRLFNLKFLLTFILTSKDWENSSRLKRIKGGMLETSLDPGYTHLPRSGSWYLMWWYRDGRETGDWCYLHTVTMMPVRDLLPVLQVSPTLSPTQVLARKFREPAVSSIAASASSVRLGMYSFRMRQYLELGGQGEGEGGETRHWGVSTVLHWLQCRQSPRQEGSAVVSSANLQSPSLPW